MKKQIILLLVLAYLVCLNTSGQITNNKSPFLIKQNGKFGFIGATGKIVIEPKLYWAEDFSEGLALITVVTVGKGYIDATGAMAIAPKFADARGFKEGLAAVAFDPTGRGEGLDGGPNYDWGFIDRQGKQVILSIYHDAGSFSEGLAPVETKSYRWGFVDKGGKEVIPPQFDMVVGFSDGLALVRYRDKTGYIDHTGKFVIPMIYSEGQPFSNGVASVRIGGKAKPLYCPCIVEDLGGSFLVIDHAGKTILNSEGGYRERFSEGLAAYILHNNKCGYVDQSGKLVIAADYYRCEPFSDGVAIVRLANTTITRCIDKTGKTLFETEFVISGGFRDGLARIVELDDRNHSFFYGTIGYMDKTGKIVWQPSK